MDGGYHPIPANELGHKRRDVADIIIVTMFLHVKAVGNFQIFAFFVGMLANMKIKTTKI